MLSFANELQAESHQFKRSILAKDMVVKSCQKIKLPNVGAVALCERSGFEVQALAGDIFLLSWARDLTLTVPLSPKE